MTPWRREPLLLPPRPAAKAPVGAEASPEGAATTAGSPPMTKWRLRRNRQRRWRRRIHAAGRWRSLSPRRATTSSTTPAEAKSSGSSRLTAGGTMAAAGATTAAAASAATADTSCGSVSSSTGADVARRRLLLGLLHTTPGSLPALRPCCGLHPELLAGSGLGLLAFERPRRCLPPPPPPAAAAGAAAAGGAKFPPPPPQPPPRCMCSCSRRSCSTCCHFFSSASSSWWWYSPTTPSHSGAMVPFARETAARMNNMCARTSFCRRADTMCGQGVRAGRRVSCLRAITP